MAAANWLTAQKPVASTKRSHKSDQLASTDAKSVKTPQAGDIIANDFVMPEAAAPVLKDSSGEKTPGEASKGTTSISRYPEEAAAVTIVKKESVSDQTASTGRLVDKPAAALEGAGATEKPKKPFTSEASPIILDTLEVGKGAKRKKAIDPGAPSIDYSTFKVSVGLVNSIDGSLNDFSPTPYMKGIVFVSNSHKLKKGVKIGDADDPEDYNLKFAGLDSTGALSKPSNFSRRLNSAKTHEGPVSFSPDFKTMFITRNTAFDDGKKRGKTTSNLKIFIKRLVDEEWTGEETLPFESDRYNYCHPTVSADGTKLYFASDIPGGFGGMDLYMSRKLKGGEWSQPINLGARVNTDKNEVFPFLTDKGTLYFSSNGRPGARGLDIYKFDVTSRTARPVSLGEPFNSEADDFGIMFMPGTSKKGYFSSNRKGGVGGDDIYEFEIK